MDSAVLSSNRKDCEMKSSHYTTPRNLADCSFEIGHYTYRPISDRPTFLQFLFQATVGLCMIGALLALMLGYFDVLVK